jgi:hypothetical protein
VVAGAPSVIEPVVEDDDYKVAVPAGDPGDEDEDEDWPEDLPEDLLDSASEIEVRIEDRRSRTENRTNDAILDLRSSILDPHFATRSAVLVSRNSPRSRSPWTGRRPRAVASGGVRTKG